MVNFFYWIAKEDHPNYISKSKRKIFNPITSRNQKEKYFYWLAKATRMGLSRFGGRIG
jgi:hypothetical protein